MLFTLQRYEFFSKSQLPMISLAMNRRCCLPCKGTNFLANHNRIFAQMQNSSDVVYLAKVRIFQQITTNVNRAIIVNEMLFTLQRYEFFSKSQLWRSIYDIRVGCCLPCKGTNFLANHNAVYVIYLILSDVVYLAKVRIFQQITT